jgi:hypothetical protein
LESGPPRGDHDWWTPEHPEDGLSWDDSDPARAAPRRRARGGPRLRRAVERRRLLAIGAAVVVVVVVAVILISSGGTTILGPPLPGLRHPATTDDPFAYVGSRESAFVSRAAAGNAQVLFTESPGGAIATAARVAGFRSLIDAAVKGTRIDPNVLEAMVFLESAGRPQVIAGNDAADAAGLTQILAATGQSLLGMHIDLAASRRLTGQIANAQDAGNTRLVNRLVARRAAVDDRFVPAKALAATVRYLEIAERRFGRFDLAVESYHMGIGNLQQVLDDYDGGTPVPYVRVYFDTSPTHHATAYNLLQSFSDSSELYYWRVLGAETIMHLYRTDRAALEHLNQLETSFASDALVLVPPGRVAQFGGPAALSAAYQRRELLPLPRNGAELGLAYSAEMGALAHALKVPRSLYSGLRPAALDMLIELVARIRAISGVKTTLTVASTVADARYDARLGVNDPPALTGYTFQIERRYPTEAVAVAFQSLLDRLQSLNLIAWIRGTSTIEITVAPDADRVLSHGV